MKLQSTLLLILLVSCSLFSYPKRLIDMPTAKTLRKASFTVDSRIMPPGGNAHGAGVLLGMDFGVTDRFEVGVSYGGDGVVGRGDIDWYPWPGAHIKYRIFDESYEGPAFAVGIDMQGFGGKAGDYRGFIYKSAGFYGVVSKGFAFTERVGVDWHLLVNYSLEEASKVKWPNSVIGMDLEFNSELYFLMEYDFAFNQKDINEKQNRYGHIHRGFLSMGVKWLFLGNFGLQFNVRDVFQQRLGSYVENDDDRPHGWGRELLFQYIGSF